MEGGGRWAEGGQGANQYRTRVRRDSERNMRARETRQRESERDKRARETDGAAGHPAGHPPGVVQDDRHAAKRVLGGDGGDEHQVDPVLEEQAVDRVEGVERAVHHPWGQGRAPGTNCSLSTTPGCSQGGNIESPSRGDPGTHRLQLIELLNRESVHACGWVD